jgi:hypothetical protein
MLTDRYGNTLTTTSAAARDAYVAGVDLLLSAGAGVEQAFRDAIAADPQLAVAHAGLARTLQVQSRAAEGREAMARAMELLPALSAREKSHIGVFDHLVRGKSPDALSAARAHLVDYPRDAMVLAPCTSVFGLIGFSGRAGREAELLALMDGLAGAYGDDWWFLAMYAFAQSECGKIGPALANIERSLALHPRNAHGAHIRSHVYYENGEPEAGLGYVRTWWASYPKEGQLHCHLAWHIALWELELGRPERAWEVYHGHVRPGASWGPPINTLSDSASFLFRAELAGEPRRAELWRDLSAYAIESFPKPGVTFADVHSALAHAFAGNADALAAIETGARGPAADIVSTLARAFGAAQREDWAEACGAIAPAVAEHERIGGSRAQRDLIEYAYATCLLRAGQADRARAYLAARRLGSAQDWPLAEMRTR